MPVTQHFQRSEIKLRAVKSRSRHLQVESERRRPSLGYSCRHHCSRVNHRSFLLSNLSIKQTVVGRSLECRKNNLANNNKNIAFIKMLHPLFLFYSCKSDHFHRNCHYLQMKLIRKVLRKIRSNFKIDRQKKQQIDESHLSDRKTSNHRAGDPNDLAKEGLYPHHSGDLDSI